MKKPEIKTIVFRMTEEEYRAVRDAVTENIGKVPMSGNEETVRTFLPDEVPEGLKSRIEIICTRRTSEHGNVYCYLTFEESNGFLFSKLIQPKDIERRTGRPKTYHNEVFSHSHYIVKFA